MANRYGTAAVERHEDLGVLHTRWPRNRGESRERPAGRSGKTRPRRDVRTYRNHRRCSSAAGYALFDSSAGTTSLLTDCHHRYLVGTRRFTASASAGEL
jgi:hypothetical protein